MKNIKKLLSAIMISVFTISLAGCKMIEKTPEAIKKSPVAKVGKETITRGDLDEKIAPVIDQIKMQYGDDYEKNDQAKQLLETQKKQTLDYLINLKMFTIKGEELKAIPAKEELDKEIDKRLGEIKSMYGNDDAKFQEAMKQENLTEEVLRGYLKEQIIYQKVQDFIVKEVTVDDAAAEKKYNESKEEYASAQVAHILVKTEDEAKKIKERLDKKEDFAALAKEFGTDGTKDNGGDLGVIEFNTKQYDQDFMAAVKKLKDGEISGPVQTQFGYHIIKVTNLKSKTFEEVKESIKQELVQAEQQTVYNKTIEDWKKELKVKTYEKNL